jgi:hypothetical protein
MLGVHRRRRGHGHHVHRIEEGVDLVERPSAQRHGHGRRALRMRVQHGGEDHAGLPRVLPRVVAAEHPGADHTAAQRIHHAALRMRRCA